MIIWRAFSLPIKFKYVKINLVPESSEENKSEIIPESSEENQEIKEELEPKQELKQEPMKSGNVNEPKTKGKFKEFKTDEIVNIINNNTSKAAFKILNEKFKDIYTETQIRNYIARYKMKSGNWINLLFLFKSQRLIKKQ